MKLWTLLENTACREDLTAEHGLSLYIETGGLRLLFDMGQSAAFARNAETLGIDLSLVDMAVLSHGHYDHGGGLEAFLQINPTAPVYVSQFAFEPHFNTPQRDIGLDPALQAHPRLHSVSQITALAPGVTLCPGPIPGPIPSGTLLTRREGHWIPEDFRHEQYLLIEEGGKRILISGCSHRGIENIAAHFHPDILIGGFHLMKQEDEAALTRTAQRLLSLPTSYITGHCTGQPQYAFLKSILSTRIQALSTGSVFEI